MYALLIAGADIESRTSNGQTCLYLACCLGNEKALAALLDAGVDTSHKDDFGCTAKDYAARNGRSDIVDLFFKDYCAKSPRSKSSGEELHDCEYHGSRACVESTIEEPDVSNLVQLPLGEKSGDLARRPKLPSNIRNATIVTLSNSAE